MAHASTIAGSELVRPSSFDDVLAAIRDGGSAHDATGGEA